MKNIINLILAAVGMAMGIAVVVLGIVDPDFGIGDSVTLLGIAVAALGLLALNSIDSKSE